MKLGDHQFKQKCEVVIIGLGHLSKRKRALNIKLNLLLVNDFVLFIYGVQIEFVSIPRNKVNPSNKKDIKVIHFLFWVFFAN